MGILYSCNSGINGDMCWCIVSKFLYFRDCVGKGLFKWERNCLVGDV